MAFSVTNEYVGSVAIGANDRPSSGREDEFDAAWRAMSSWFSDAHQTQAKEYVSDLYADSTKALDKLERFCMLNELAGEDYKARFSDTENQDGHRIYMIETEAEDSPSLVLPRPAYHSLNWLYPNIGTDYAQLGQGFSDSRSVAAALIREVSDNNLTSLSLKGCPLITSLPDNLPDSLKTLSISDCVLLSELPPTLPQQLISLSLSRCPSFIELPDNLPHLLRFLMLLECDSLEALPASLPDSMHTISIQHCNSIANLPSRLPSSLREFSLAHCAALTDLPESLPDSLQELSIDNCNALQAIRALLPQSLHTLALRMCNSLTAMPKELPSSLTFLMCSGTRLLAALPENLPPSLKVIWLDGCSSLRSLPQKLPPLLQELDLENCTNLWALPGHLPCSLTTLNLNGCTSLIELPNLSNPGVSISFRGCTLLENPPDYSARPHELWYRKAATSDADMARLRDTWHTVEDEAHFESFKHLLLRLSQKALKKSMHAPDVVELIKEVIESPSTRQQVFELAQAANQDCHDRPLSIFSTAQSFALFSKLQRENAPVATLVNLAQGIVKIRLLDQAAIHVMQKQWTEGRRSSNMENNGPNMREALEVQLELHRVLADVLDLPVKIQPLHSVAIANLNDSDKAFAVKHVQDIMIDIDRNIQALIAVPVWATYIKDVYKAEIEQIHEYHGELLEKFEEKVLQLPLKDYVEGCKALLANFETAIEALIAEKTKTILGQLSR